MHVSSSQQIQSRESEIESLIQKMTLAEKIGQMTQPEKNSVPPEDVTKYFLGSVLSGGGGNPVPNTPENWAAMVRIYEEAALKTRLAIPLIYGVDAVHGHNNMHGAVIFPHNIGLGATGDADLIRRAGAVTAAELLASNIHYDFAPAVSVPQDIRWGRSFEGFSEETAPVTKFSTAFMQGLQDGENRVLACIKHYVGDGATSWGTPLTYDWLGGNFQAPGDDYKLDQGDSLVDEATLRAVHLPPYKAAIEAGALSVMVSFSSWQGLKMHAHRYLLTDVLKNEFGFEGFVISDWMGVSQIDPSYVVSVATSINAGVDMVMVPYDYKTFITTLTNLVESGDVTMARIDDAVRRILRVKAWVGLFEAPFGREDLLSKVGSDDHRQVAREAVQKSQVLLKNDGVLPLSKGERLLIAGRGADNIGMQSGGWTITWQGDHGETTLGTSIYNAILNTAADGEALYDPEGALVVTEKVPVGIVIVGETPYAEGLGDNSNLHLSQEDRDVINRVRANCEKLVIILLSGRPIIITEEIAKADAFIAAFQPGTEGQGVADILFGDAPFTGRLPVSWPRSMAQVPLTALKQDPQGPLFPLGYGLS